MLTWQDDRLCDPASTQQEEYTCNPVASGNFYLTTHSVSLQSRPISGKIGNTTIMSTIAATKATPRIKKEIKPLNWPPDQIVGGPYCILLTANFYMKTTPNLVDRAYN
jgi:hypothetical protein